ncbi:hypothetical protein D6D15_08507 [Aureobasidium pullulans]|uniref:Glucose-methanol-choline oxidoreductase C-terminal domain-containing protein n=1 Tax=Aureobasidium pullulans TaxID=5580 RepID=A0A4S9AXS1_AURPU|nr:hypothetical protein D6D15_08507 [Aureobasidium pullulans]
MSNRIILSFVSGEQMYRNFLTVDKTTALSYQVNVETTSVFSNDPQRIFVETENYITEETGLLTSKNGNPTIRDVRRAIANPFKATVIGQRSKCQRYASTPHIYSTKQANVSLPSAPFDIGLNDGVRNFASLTIGLLAITLAITAFKFARHLASTSSLHSAIIEEVIPGPAVRTDAEIIASLKQSVATFYYASCTSRVIGVTGLRVVDASVFPFLVLGQPQATVDMLAEKIVEVVLGDA